MSGSRAEGGGGETYQLLNFPPLSGQLLPAHHAPQLSENMRRGSTQADDVPPHTPAPMISPPCGPTPRQDAAVRV
jgi:hypothetical protein